MGLQGLRDDQFVCLSFRARARSMLGRRVKYDVYTNHGSEERNSRRFKVHYVDGNY